MNKFDLELGFKGARKYIQGPDIFNESIRVLANEVSGEITRLEFLIHKMTDRELYLIIDESVAFPVHEEQDIATLRLNDQQKQFQARICATAYQPARRQPYDESTITNRCILDTDAKEIILKDNAVPYSVMEVLVSMNKALHLAVLPKPEGSSWVFCRWDSPAWPLPENIKGVTVSLKQALGTRLTRSDVSLDGKLLGQIYFSAKAAK